MKLCRFELLDTPGVARSGIVYSGKIYETDGENPSAVHEAEAVRPLAPVGRPPSFRILRPSFADDEAVRYVYGNPSSVIGASQIVPRPDFTERLDYEPYLAAVIVQDCQNVTVEQADYAILGLTILILLVARDVEEAELRAGAAPGRSFDFAAAAGPVITTPDELDDHVIDEEFGRKYELSVVTRVNGVEKRRGATNELRTTFAQLISEASFGCPLRAGDLFAIGPIAAGDDLNYLEPGDEIQVSVEKLGTLAVKIAL